MLFRDFVPVATTMMLGFNLAVKSSVIITFCGTIIITCAIYEGRIEKSTARVNYVCSLYWFPGKCSVFKIQPKNKTVKYGEIVQFECQIHRESSQGFYLYFGNTLVYPLLQGNFSALDQREFSVNVNQCTNCLQNQTIIVGRVWILINSRTLQIIEPFWCRVTHSRISEDSCTAYVEVVYPECTVTPLRSSALLVSSTFVPPREHPVKSASVSIQVFNHPCSTGELNTQDMHASNQNVHFILLLMIIIFICTVDDIKANKLAISICAGLILIMLTLLILTYACICIQHQKQLSCGKNYIIMIKYRCMYISL